jgi:hypothetical protein
MPDATAENDSVGVVDATPRSCPPSGAESKVDGVACHFRSLLGRMVF